MFNIKNVVLCEVVSEREDKFADIRGHYLQEGVIEVDLFIAIHIFGDLDIVSRRQEQCLEDVADQECHYRDIRPEVGPFFARLSTSH